MANTNFAALTNEEKTIWARDVWSQARNMSFINQFAGRSANSMVQRITELRKSEKGARAVITLVHDLIGDGVTGDYTLEQREESMSQDDQVIRIDQLRNGTRHEGRLADQKSVVMFREQARDKLAYWLADRMDQLAFLTLSGISYANHNSGSTRPVKTVGGNLTDLEFAADVSAPSSQRQYRWDAGTSSWVLGADTANLVAADTLSYKALVDMKAIAKEHYIRGIRTGRNEEVFHVFVSPTAMSKLKLDSDYLANVRNAGVRGGNNELFAGTTSVMVDGLVIHEHRHVYNTRNAASGSKWGGGTVDGCAALFCGAQALGMADIGNAYWVEKDFDYDNQPGISVGKMFGFLKPKFTSIYESDTATKEDFGVIRMDVAQ